MRGDGDGWAQGPDGEKRWGLFGAAGLLLRAPSGDGGGDRPQVLLQLRAEWSHQGGTWALPGGARDSHETVVDAAVREAEEETGIPAAVVAVRATRRTAGADDGWTYTTVVADAPTTLDPVPNRESVELRWVDERDVSGLDLHRGFAEAWPALRTRPVRLVLDMANLVGSRPHTQWWRDRAGATSALLDEVAAALPRTVELPGGGYGWIDAVDAVVEGQARGVTCDDPRVRIVVAPAVGDDEIVRCATAWAAEARAEDDPSAGVVAVATADRGLRDRLPADVVALAPSEVLGWTPDTRGRRGGTGKR